MENKKYYIELEVITPLAVGAGNDNDWIRGADFVQNDGKLYVIDIKKVIEQGIDVDELNALFIKQDEKGICKLLGNHLEQISKYIFKLPIRTNNPVKSFLRTQLYNNPLVAGSSIKGAIRSSLFHYLRDEEKTNEEVFGVMKNGSDFMRFLKIGDIEMKNTILVNSKIFNLWMDEEGGWYGGWKQDAKKTTSNYSPSGFNTLYECVQPGEKGVGTIILSSDNFQSFIDTSALSVSHIEKKKDLMGKGITKLFKAINTVTKGYLQKEKSFFEQYSTDRTSDIEQCIDNLLEMIPEDGSSCLMKMSAGVGFHSITGDWQYDDYDDTGIWDFGHHSGKKKYKSRKIAEYEGKLQLMGFVKMKAISSQESSERILLLEKEHAETLNCILSSAQEKADRERMLLEERKLREEEKKKKQLNLETYNSLLETARQLYLDNKLTEALQKATEASTLLPEGEEHQTLIEKIDKSIEAARIQKEIEDKKKNQLSLPLSDVLAGKTSVGNILGHLEKWLKQDGNSFGDSEMDALEESMRGLPNKEQKKLNGTRRRISNIIGEEKTALLFNKLNMS